MEIDSIIDPLKYFLVDGQSDDIINGTFDLTTNGLGTFGELDIDTLNLNGRTITNSSGFLQITSDDGVSISFSDTGASNLLLSPGEITLAGDLGLDSGGPANAAPGAPFTVTLRDGGAGTGGGARGGKGGSGTFTAGDGGNSGTVNGPGGGWDFICGATGTGGGAATLDGKFTITVVGDGSVEVIGPLNVSGALDVDGVTNLDVLDVDDAADFAKGLVLSTDGSANNGLALKGFGEVGGSRGGVITWYHNAEGISGYTFGQGTAAAIPLFVWKDAKSTASNDTGNAWVNFKTGDCSFDQGNFTFINSIMSITGTSKLGDGGSSNYTQFSATGSIGFFGSAEVETDMPFKDAVFPIIDKASGNGIKIDTAAPTFSFRDLVGDIKTRPAAGGGAAAQPDFVVYRGSIYGYRFGTNAPNNHIHEAFIEYHVPHDYVPGTDIHMHVHWSQATVDDIGGGVPGVAEWFFDITYADGYGTAGGAGDPFVAPKTISVTQQGSTTQYGHMIAEVIITGATDTATTFDRATIEVDGLFLLRVYRTPGAGNDTLIEDTFVHFGDMHYQTTNIGTKDKNAPFYT